MGFTWRAGGGGRVLGAACPLPRPVGASSGGKLPGNLSGLQWMLWREARLWWGAAGGLVGRGWGEVLEDQGDGHHPAVGGEGSGAGGEAVAEGMEGGEAEGAGGHAAEQGAGPGIGLGEREGGGGGEGGQEPGIEGRERADLGMLRVFPQADAERIGGAGGGEEEDGGSAQEAVPVLQMGEGGEGDTEGEEVAAEGFFEEDPGAGWGGLGRFAEEEREEGGGSEGLPDEERGGAGEVVREEGEGEAGADEQGGEG